MTLVDRLWSTRRLQPLARLAHDRLNSFFNFDIISQCPPEVRSSALLVAHIKFKFSSLIASKRVRAAVFQELTEFNIL